ncbi:MAG TPA: pre-peptidase C-terminal domain-containing protein [Pirellulales bacterium]|nr:pre-peptidase C-terminal domain-containing protein [Pirellulales bacterium]
MPNSRRARRGARPGQFRPLTRLSLGSGPRPLVFEWLEPRLLLSATTSLVAVPFPASSDPYVASPTYLTLDYPGTTTAATGGSPVGNGLNPTQILNAYGINQITFDGGTVQGDGAGQTIAIIDAFNDPNIAEDLATFDTAFGIPAPPSFQVVSQTGSTSVLPVNDGSGWAVEESLDVEWSHAIAPDAKILLVEANSNYDDDLATAVAYAEGVPGVSVVSMSYSGGEDPSETSEDSLYTTPAGHTGVTFLAATGDHGEPSGYPAYSPNVVAVGGTTLTTDAAGDYLGESGWGSGTAGKEGSGGGLSLYEPQPAYQNGVVTQSSTQRAVPDVSFDSDPSSGPAVIDSYTYGSADPWLQVGGTSFATPSWAALIAIADQGRAVNGLSPLDGATQTLPILYALQDSGAYYDITTGNNGYAAGPGYDLVTGIGTPLANVIVPALASDLALTSTNLIVTATNPGADTILSTAPSTFVVDFDTPYDSSSVEASDFIVNGVAASSYSVDSSTSITFDFGSSPVTAVGLQTETLSGIFDADGETAMTPLNETFRYDPDPITVVSTTPGVGDLAEVPLTTLDVTFSEPYAASSISTSNLSLSVGTVTGFTLVPATNTVDYTISGINAEVASAQLTVSMAYGAVTDPEGDPNQQAFSSSYSLDVTTAPFPTRLIATGGLGSLVYQGSIVGTIGFVGDTDSYTLNLDAGETLTVIGTAAAGLQPSLSMQGPSGTTIASASAPGAGQAALLQTVAVATTGQYTITISGLDDETGVYTLQAYVNAAVQDEQYGGSPNNSQASAQALSGSFISLAAGASQGAVLGTLNSSTDQDWYSFPLSGGDTIALNGEVLGTSGNISIVLWSSTGTSLATSASLGTDFDQTIGDIVVPTTGTYYAQVTGAASTQYSLVLTRDADHDNQQNTSLATAQALAGTQIDGQQVVVGDISDPVIEAFGNADSLNAYTKETFGPSGYSLNAPETSTLTAAAAHDGPLGLSTGYDMHWHYDPTTQVKQGETLSVWLQPTSEYSVFDFGFGASATGTLMVGLDSIQQILEITNVTAGSSSYANSTGLGAVSQTYTSGQWYLLQVVWATGGKITANLYGSDGTTLVNTVSGTNNSVTSGGIALSGVYFYADTITTNVLPTPTYSFTAVAGSTLMASTATPGDGAAGLDMFDPDLLLYNSAGTLVASDDNSGADGRNALLTYNVPAGASGTYYVQVVSSPLTAEPIPGDYVLTVQAAPPTVVGAFVSSTAWNASYLSMLDAAGLGSSAASGQGFELAGGSNQLTTMLAWTNINQISIAFSETVNVSQSSLTLYNSANTAIPTSGFSYNSTANIATWQFSTALVANKYVMNLAGASISNTVGTELDGAWNTSVSTFAAGSGDGTPGSDFNFYFNVLPGDGNNSSAVTNAAVLLTKLQVGAVADSSNYQLDVNGATNITNSDVLLEKLQVGSNINTFLNPQLPPQSESDALPADVLFSPAAPAPAPSDSSSGSSVVVSPAAGSVVPTPAPAAAASQASASPADAPGSGSNVDALANFTVYALATAGDSAADTSQTTASPVPMPASLVVIAPQNVSAVQSPFASPVMDAVFASLPSPVSGIVPGTATASAPLEGSSTVSAPGAGLPALTAVFGLLGGEQDVPATADPMVATLSTWSPAANPAQTARGSGVAPAAAVIAPKPAARIQSSGESADLAPVHRKLSLATGPAIHIKARQPGN